MSIYFEELTSIEASLGQVTGTVERHLKILKELEERLFDFYDFYMKDVKEHPLSLNAVEEIRDILGDSDWLIKDFETTVSELNDTKQSLSVVLDNIDMGL